jgi:hypothetical protein
MLKNFLRHAVLWSVALGSLVAACGAASSGGFDEASPSSSGGGGSAGSSGGGSGGGSGGSFGDGGAATDAADAGAEGGLPTDGSVPPATVVFLHASPSLPSLRLCFLHSAGESLQPFPANNEMPASNYSGIPVGGAVWLPDAFTPPIVDSMVYALRAKPIAGQTYPCDRLICATPGSSWCLMQNDDYWQVGPLPSTAVRAGATTVVAVAGCLGADDPLASVERCGPTWKAATGNLHLDVVAIPDSPGNGANDAGVLTVQAAQLSPGLESLQGEGGATTISFGSQADAQAVVQLAHEGDLGPSPPFLLTLPGAIGAYGQLGFAVDVTGAEAGSSGYLWMSLAQAEQLVNPAQDPSAYYAGGPFLVAVLGDPAAPHAFGDGDGGYDGKGLHMLVVPVGPPSP